jgi:hypothetical protein
MSSTHTRWSLFFLWLAVTLIHLPALSGGTYFLDVYLTEVHPNMAALGRALSQWEIPFWEPGIMLGYPLASNPQVGVFYLPHLLGAFFLDAHALLIGSAYAHSLLAALGVFVLARHLKCSHIAAVIAALVYACSPFIVYYHQAIHGLVALAFLPWIVWCSWTAAQSGSLRRWALGAILLALQMYAGHLQFVLYTSVLATMAAVWGVTHNDRRKRLKVFGLAAGQNVVALLLYAPQLLSAYVLWRNSLRSSLSAADMVAKGPAEALGLDDLVETVMPNFFGGPSLQDFWYPEFMGVAVLLLALVALTNWDSITRFWALVLGLAVVYLCFFQWSFGTQIMASIPVLKAFRAPGRILCWVLLAVALLAGRGLDHWANEPVPKWIRALAAVAGLVAVCVLVGLFDSLSGRDPGRSQAFISALRRVDAWWLMATVFAMGVATYGVVTHQRAAKGIMAAAAVLPLLWVAHHYNPVVDEAPPSPFVSLIKQRDPSARLLGVSAGDPNYMASVPSSRGWPYGGEGDPKKAGWSLVSNLAMAHGLKNMHAQTSLPLTTFVERFYGRSVGALKYPFQQQPHIRAELLRHAHVSYVVASSLGQMPVQARPQPLAKRDGYTLFDMGE